MKRSVFAICLVLAAAVLQAETIKMKDGELISGSILSQTEYTLNLATSYGNITLNQREIEAILPDKHRLILKGGTQLVGVILDLDEFNLNSRPTTGPSSTWICRKSFPLKRTITTAAKTPKKNL